VYPRTGLNTQGKIIGCLSRETGYAFCSVVRRHMNMSTTSSQLPVISSGSSKRSSSSTVNYPEMNAPCLYVTSSHNRTRCVKFDSLTILPQKIPDENGRAVC
jgi:hypothetical protein